MHRTTPRWFITKIFKVSKPPVSGYELAELPNEKILHDFMQHYRTKGVLVVLHGGSEPYKAPTVSKLLSSPLTRPPTSPSASAAGKPSSSSASSTPSLPIRLATQQRKAELLKDPLTRSYISSMNAMNLGNPDEVKIALVPGMQCPKLMDEFNVITFPTTLLFLNGQCVYRVVGARTRELSIKSLFMLRNGARNIFSRE